MATANRVPTLAVTSGPAASDMSPAALRRRLEEVGALYKLAMHLQTAKPDGQR